MAMSTSDESEDWFVAEGSQCSESCYMCVGRYTPDDVIQPFLSHGEPTVQFLEQ